MRGWAGAPLSMLVVLSALVAACSAGKEDPVPASYVVNFPSVSAAAATDNVIISVFEATSDDACQQLVLAKRTLQELPPALFVSAPIPVCALEGPVDKIEVSYGKRAFLAVATEADKNILIGCTVGNVFAQTPPLVISLTLFDDQTSLPKSPCVQLSDWCQQRC